MQERESEQVSERGLEQVSKQESARANERLSVRGTRDQESMRLESEQARKFIQPLLVFFSFFPHPLQIQKVLD